MRRFVLIPLGILLGLIVLVAAVGSALPKSHMARRSMRLGRPPEEVWRVIVDFPSQPGWRKELASVVRLPDVNGEQVWNETPKSGDPLPLRTTALEAPRRLVRTIADPSLPFGGRWVYELAPDGAGTYLTITEQGEVYNPIFRFVGRFFLDQARTIEVYMRALAAHFGETAVIERGG